MSLEHCRLERKELISMDIRQGNEWNVGGGSGMRK